MAARCFRRLRFAVYTIVLLQVAVPAGAEDPSPRIYELPDIIDLALQRNPTVAGAEAVIEESGGQRIAAGAYPNPTILGQTADAVVRDPDGTRLMERTVTLTQPLEWTGKRSARKREAEAGVAGAGVGLEEVKLNLIAEVKVAFYELLQAQQALDLAKQNLEIVEGVARIVRARVQSGEAPQFEAIKAQVEVLKANQVVTRAQNSVRVNRVVLDTLTAGALGPTYEITGDFEHFPKSMDLSDLTTRALERHPTLRRLQHLVERAGLTVVKEEQSRVPNVNVFGGYSREAFYGGIAVPTPIWYLRQGEIAAALGAKRREEAELVRARNELLRTVNQHFQDAQTTSNLIDVFEQGLLKQAQEALRIAEFSFKQGAASLLEVLDAQRVRQQVFVDYVLARFNLSVALARLERPVAGFL